MNKRNELGWSNKEILDDLKNQIIERANGNKEVNAVYNHQPTNGLTGTIISQGVAAGTTDKAPNGAVNALNTTNNINLCDQVGCSTTNIDMYHPKSLVDARITEETVELKYIRRAKYSYTQTNFTIYPSYSSYNADIAIKEIYGCRDGKLTLLKTITGRVVPPQEIPETLEFEDENEE